MAALPSRTKIGTLGTKSWFRDRRFHHDLGLNTPLIAGLTIQRSPDDKFASSRQFGGHAYFEYSRGGVDQTGSFGRLAQRVPAELFTRQAELAIATAGRVLTGIQSGRITGERGEVELAQEGTAKSIFSC